MAALQYVDNPDYAGLLLMRTYVQLSRSNALMDRCRQWLSHTDAEWRGSERKWLFPSGATLEFGHLDNEGDERRYDGPEFQYIGFDELSQFTEDQYRFLFTRLRRKVDSTVPLRMRSASNPGGTGHAWVKARFIKPGAAGRPFVPALMEDNPGIDEAEYREALQELDAVTRAQREDGNWDVERVGALFKRDWLPIVEQEPPADTKWVRYWDLAATEGGGDYTVGVLMGRSDGQFIVRDVKRKQYGAGKVETLLVATAAQDAQEVGHVDVWIEEEGGSSGKADAEAKVKLLAGHNVRTSRPTGDKAVRARPLAAQAEKGNVSLMPGDWNGAFTDELTGFDPDARNYGVPHDDQVDGASGAFGALAKVYTPGMGFGPGLLEELQMQSKGGVAGDAEFHRKVPKRREGQAAGYTITYPGDEGYPVES